MKRTLLILTTVLTLAAQCGGADAALGAAIHMEEAEGNYKGAIEAYKKFVSRYASNRALAAKAEYRLGLCYEKLGDAEARKAFERVVAKYGDQKDVVAQAQARLNAIRPPASAMLAAVKLIDKATPVGPVSRDGQWIPWTESQQGNLLLRNLKTGEERIVTRDAKNWDQYVDEAIISPDGKRVVYSFWRVRGPYRALELMNADGNGHKVLLPATPEGKDYIPIGWMPDGKTAAFLDLERGASTLCTIDVATGAVTKGAQLAAKGNIRAVLSPDGRSVAYFLPAPGDPSAIDLHVYDFAAKTSAKWTKDLPLINVPAWSPDSKTVYVVATDRGPSVVYGVRAAGAPIEIHKAGGRMWLGGAAADGTLIASEFEASYDLFRVMIDPANPNTVSAPARIKTAVLGENRAPRISPDGSTIFYLRTRGTQVPTAVLHDVATGRERELLPPKTINRISWRPDSKAIFVSSREMGDQPGAAGMWILNVNSGEFKELDPGFVKGPLHPVLGLYSRDGSELIFRTTQSEKMSIMAYHLATRQTRTIVPFGATGSFLPADISPDGKWILAFVGSQEGNVKMLVLYPTAGGEPRTILRGEGYFLGLGQFAADGKSVLVNGTFSFLGETKPALWRISLSGEQPVKLLQQETINGNPAVHPNGREIIYADGVRRHSLWAIKSAR